MLFRIEAAPCVAIPIWFCENVLLVIVAPLPGYQPYWPAETPVPFRLKLLLATTPLVTLTPHWVLSLNTLSFTLADPPVDASTPMALLTTRICSTTRLSPPRMAVKKL